MLRNYFIVTFRNAKQQKAYSLINVGGLAIGLMAALLILAYIQDTRSYDQFHQNANRIYRVNLDYNYNGEAGIGANTPPPVANRLVTDYPEVEATTRVYHEGNTMVRYQEAAFDEDDILSVDSTFLTVFDFPLLEGDAATALTAPNSIVITPTIAQKYFGDQSPLGKTLLLWEYQIPCQVTGVVASPPQNSHIQFDILYSMTGHYLVERRFDWSWIWCQVTTYALLHEDANLPALEAKMPAMVEQHGSKVLEQLSGSSYQYFVATGGRWFPTFQPLTEVYLHSVNIGNQLGSLGDINYLYIFAVVAVLMLLVAAINFMNLATARATQRAKEVGIRKTLGSRKRQLQWQFLVESLTYVTLALLLALCMAEVARMVLETTISLYLPPLSLSLLGYALGIAFVVGLLAGSYPALYLSAFSPATVLKGTINTGRSAGRLRQGLVVLQFAISISLIICTLLMQQQLDYLQQVNLGFDKENVLVVSRAERAGSELATLKQMLADRSEVASVALSSEVPGSGDHTDFYQLREGDQENFLLSALQGDYDWLATMGIQMREGRYFSRDFPSDSSAVVLNETAVRQLQLEDPIGKVITYPGACGNCVQEFTVIGVVEDFNTTSLHNPIHPFALFLYHDKNYYVDAPYLTLRIAPNKAASVIALVEDAWTTYGQGTPLQYSFLDKNFASMFAWEQQLGRLFTLFTGLTILVACLGLLGLVAYTVEKRTKEIGIRKVLGASVASIVSMLSQSFVKLMLIALLVAIPIGYYAMQEWLQNFAYRTDISFWVFLLAGLAALAITLFTISYQSIKAAVANPVDSLRNE
ncbi:MAG: ABC transporter permease [Cyclobacteriaceae bacterium]